MQNGEMTSDVPHLIEMVEVEGVWFPTFFERDRPMKEQLERVRALELREDDVILCAYPKSGTHWMWEVGSMLLAGKAEYENRTKEHVMIEGINVDKLDHLPSPRLLNTHLTAAMLPRQVTEKRVKVIHVYRNVKDVLVSLYFHMKQLGPYLLREPTLEAVEEMFLSEQCPTGNYFTYLQLMNDFIRTNPDLPVFNVSFEEMKEDPVSTVSRLGEFLGVSASQQLCRDIARACCFDRLKQADEHKDMPGYFQGDKTNMYRKGEVGDWKNHLTVAQSERLDRHLQQLQSCDFHFRYTL